MIAICSPITKAGRGWSTSVTVPIQLYVIGAARAGIDRENRETKSNSEAHHRQLPWVGEAWIKHATAAPEEMPASAAANSVSVPGSGMSSAERDPTELLRHRIERSY